jgi:hypothetical protein
MTEYDLDYKRTYSDLSKEFRNLYPTFWKAANLLPAMYNSLTLIDGFPHKDAINKIKSDHRDLPGFSARNIRRNLPLGNPHVPRRIRTSRPKTSMTASNEPSKLSNTKPSCAVEQSKDKNSVILKADEKECLNCSAVVAENRELREALKANQKFTSANTLLGSERVCSVPKDKEYILTDALKKSERVCYIFFNVAGRVVHAEADVDKMNDGNGHQ